jgi:hypothetical protein
MPDQLGGDLKCDYISSNLAEAIRESMEKGD